MLKHKAFILLLLLVLVCALPALASEIPDGYQAVAQNDDWTLYLREDTLALIMQNNLTGATMASTVLNPDDFSDNDLWKGFYQSGITVEYIEGTVNKYPWANLVYTEHSLSYTWLDNGFTCDVYYEELGLRYQVTVTLTGNIITVHIPQDQMVEEKPDEYCTI
ncbi:MAG TPA: hypothetical protein PK537_08745 [Candidatus Limiplasma sp.]|nr:hypothetical protein [Candidatus Limiplasma sp.]